ncbi:hypothetical protein, partial [Mesorhizobium sp.]|uniref:hypothetical protein n=1 Tax=Mesorhizobium sp. TaxID=1871066 RepID=UPI0025CE1E29
MAIGESFGESVLLPVTIRGEDGGSQMRGGASLCRKTVLGSAVVVLMRRAAPHPAGHFSPYS